MENDKNNDDKMIWTIAPSISVDEEKEIGAAVARLEVDLELRAIRFRLAEEFSGTLGDELLKILRADPDSESDDTKGRAQAKAQQELRNCYASLRGIEPHKNDAFLAAGWIFCKSANIDTLADFLPSLEVVETAFVTHEKLQGRPEIALVPLRFVVQLDETELGTIPAEDFFKGFQFEAPLTTKPPAKVKSRLEILTKLKFAPLLFEVRLVGVKDGAPVENADIEKVTTILRADRRFIFADPQILRQIARTQASAPVHLNGPPGGIEAEKAWRLSVAGQPLKGHGSVIAMVDVGFDLLHPSLRSAYLQSLEYRVQLGGHVKPVSHRQPSECLVDVHGTRSAGHALAPFRPGSPVGGVAPAAKLFAVQIPEPIDSQLTLARTIACAADPTIEIPNSTFQKADVISISIAREQRWVRERVLELALDFAENHGLSICWSVGNHDRHSGGNEVQADFRVVGVGASNHEGGRRSSASGRVLKILAPGDRVPTIDSSAPTNGITASGTSLSTPQVAGVVALLKQIDRYLSPAQIRRLLFETCDKLGGSSVYSPDFEVPGTTRSPTFGYGRVNAYQAALAALSNYQTTLRQALGVQAAAAPAGVAGAGGTYRPRLHGSSLPRVTRSKLPLGRFGRLFRQLPPWEPPGADEASRIDNLRALADSIHYGGRSSDNIAIPAGYTYFGQFIDHDLTFDATSTLSRANDPDELYNFRTPALDLDAVYGGGPKVRPDLYDDYDRFVLGAGVGAGEADLPRIPQTERAIIGDPRNDENTIISQLHLAFLKCHNRLIDEGRSFELARRDLQWHYQWLVLNDFLPRIVGDCLLRELLQEEPVCGLLLKPDVRKLRFYQPKLNAFLPVEWSAAGFRFGHSMVRDFYILRRGIGPFPIFVADENPDSELDLRGGKVLPANWTIDWEVFLGDHSGVQASLSIDGLVSPLLGQIPVAPGAPLQSLAFLNLLRGWRLDLPSGQAVARVMGGEEISNFDLGLTRIPGWEHAIEAPLWFYLLKEAERLRNGSELGPVGARLVAEVVIGLALHDPTCYLRIDPSWQPRIGKTFRLLDLIKFGEGSGQL